MKKVSLLATVVILLGLGLVSNATANSYSPVGNENTISTQIDLDGGIIDSDDLDDEDRDDRNK